MCGSAYPLCIAYTYRVYGSFMMETILAIAFGRVINLQRGEADQLTEAIHKLFTGLQEGQTLSRDTLVFIVGK